MCVSAIIFADRKLQTFERLHLDDKLSPAPFPGSVRLTYGRPSSPETRPPSYFPRPLLRASSRTLALQNTWMNGSSTAFRSLRIQAVGGGHFRSRIAGKWFPDETPNGDFQ